jgi:NADH dehydrogenase [ubiquinone] 1 alpha subcomplex assembly factor 3
MPRPASCCPATVDTPCGVGDLILTWLVELLILGIGPQMRPISPETRKAITKLGMRVEVLDTRNAASQFTLLATERGINNVAAALMPVGWKDGTGTS